VPGERITVRERLDPEITRSLFANYRSAVEAVLELVDNAVDSRLSGRALRVDLVVRPAYVQITTVGGRGMGPREVEASYLRWGSSPKRGRDLLGQYGQGGKAAIGHLGEGFTIDASRPGDTAAWQFSDTRYRDRSRLKVYELHPIEKRVDEGLGYVRIRIEAVDKRVDPRRVAARLAETYRPLLEAGSLTLTVNGGELRPPPIHTVERHEFEIEAPGGLLRGWVGVLAEPGPAADPGLRCYRLGRLVAGGEFFGHSGPAQQPALARLAGEVEVPGVPLTTSKSDFDRDSGPWIEVEDRLHRLLAPLVDRLAREAEAPPPAAAVRAAERARRLLGRALRLSGSGTPAAETTAAEQSPQQELAMPGGDWRRPAPGRIVLRRLDRSLRSRTVEEDGASLIVINTHHPLFEARRGDTWYQLETAVRAVLATEDGLSPAEYERRVDEVLGLALDLQRRRRRPRGPRQPQLDLLG
jgi:Histidine kinase-, DNA gyrase B-, and HSP90-like ATPase